MSGPVRLGLVGFGKIAQDQHLPAIAASPDFTLLAVASRNAQADNVRNYVNIETMLEAEPDLNAIVLCQPPQVRFAAARAALLAGKHVFMEKPPGATLSEVEALISLADRAGAVLFASWHSRQAACVARAKAWIAGRTLRSIRIVWKEDVRHWHPGQAWIWRPGGFGVFDPGINALSLLTEIVAEPIRLLHATLETPINRQAPIAANLRFETTLGTPITADLDWRQTGPQIWDIVVETEDGTLRLEEGGNSLVIDDIAEPPVKEAEYPALYTHFAGLIAAARSDVDLSPLRLVADAFLCGEHRPTDAFYEGEDEHEGSEGRG